MGEVFPDEHVRQLRSKKKFKMDGSFSVVDELEATGHLIHALMLACESIEDVSDRNAFVSLLAEIELRVDVCSDHLKEIKQTATPR